jgi:hypothetical protein
MPGGAAGGGGTPAVTIAITLFVFSNCSGGECIIGVADASYSEPGWSMVSPPFQGHDDAWRYACDLHDQEYYRSPDIDQGRVQCAALGHDAQAAGGQCRGLACYDRHPGRFLNGSGIGTGEYEHTPASCAAKCDAESRCKSFNMYGLDYCTLSARNSSEKSLSNSDSYTYFERVSQ